MLLSLSLIILVALLLSSIFIKLKLPPLIGMLITGLLLGPFFLDLIDISILNISYELRQLALIVILFRAGLSLDINRLRKIGRPALLISFIPATLEVIAIVILAPLFFPISYLEAALLGAIVAAVSPAVIVPRMIKFIDKKNNHQSYAPELVLAGASLDDVYVIVLFTAFLAIAREGQLEVLNMINFPIKITLGILLGITLGVSLVYLFKKFHLRDTIKVLIILSVAAMLLYFEQNNNFFISFSGLLATLVIGLTINKTYPVLANRLKIRFDQLWVIAEIVLFVLVGALIDLSVISTVGILAVILITSALIFRTLGVYLSVLKSKLTKNEKAFTAIAYLPKATVQAALGSIPLALGIPNGDIIFAVSIVAIILTAPIGAILIDYFGPKLLEKDEI
jgi:solute carrier family 9B (sodium/hydrogen exchanger), member 1/2